MRGEPLRGPAGEVSGHSRVALAQCGDLVGVRAHGAALPAVGVDLGGDALTARVERAHEAFLRQRLRILGYLTTHTRQLDMAMTDNGALRCYRDQFILEIEAMLCNDQ